MAHHPVGRFDVELIADFADGGAVAASLDLYANEVVDFPLPFGELAKVRHGKTSQRCPQGWSASEPPPACEPKYIIRSYTRKDLFFEFAQEFGYCERLGMTFETTPRSPDRTTCEAFKFLPADAKLSILRKTREFTGIWRDADRAVVASRVASSNDAGVSAVAGAWRTGRGGSRRCAHCAAHEGRNGGRIGYGGAGAPGAHGQLGPGPRRRARHLRNRRRRRRHVQHQHRYRPRRRGRGRAGRQARQSLRVEP